MRFIAQAIESVLMQETDFPFELVIGEDCSTDKTPEIVERFAALRPDVIRAVLNKKTSDLSRNFGATLERCRGSYIALLEGDDYWVSSSKLQKQVDFFWIVVLTIPSAGRVIRACPRGIKRRQANLRRHTKRNRAALRTFCAGIIY